jgi:hypothetical protein
MATIEARGYVNRPESKVSKSGKHYSKFSLSVKQKEKAYGDLPERITWMNLYVTDFNNASPPTEKAFVTVKGYLKTREYEVEGNKRSGLEVNATEIEVAPSMDGASAAATKAGATKDPWED